MISQQPSGSVDVVPTPLQLAILREKTAGRTDTSAARALNLGERTVRRQLVELMDQLGVRGRAELFVEVGRRGWLDRGEVPTARALADSAAVARLGQASE